jgi:hypothetical protein
LTSAAPPSPSSTWRKVAESDGGGSGRVAAARDGGVEGVGSLGGRRGLGCSLPLQFRLRQWSKQRLRAAALQRCNGGGANRWWSAGVPRRPRASAAPPPHSPPPPPPNDQSYPAATFYGATAYAWPRLVKPDDSRPQVTPMLWTSG